MNYERQLLKIAQEEIGDIDLLEFYLTFSRETETNYATWDSLFLLNGQIISSIPNTGANRTCNVNGVTYEGRLLTTDISVRNAYHMGEIVIL